MTHHRFLITLHNDNNVEVGKRGWVETARLPPGRRLSLGLVFLLLYTTSRQFPEPLPRISSTVPLNFLIYQITQEGKRTRRLCRIFALPVSRSLKHTQ